MDCTNSRDGTKVIIYTQVGGSQVFVRDLVEFYEKFERT